MVDNCSNSAADQVQTITIRDNTAPTFTAPANITIYTSATCTYDAGIAFTGDVTNESDNCSTGLNATFVDAAPVAIVGCQGGFTIARTWSLVDNCSNSAADQVQTITIRDNTAPKITSLIGSLDATVQCSDVVSLAIVPTATDNCSVPTIHLISDVKTTDATCANAYKRVRTWNFTDGCGNVSADFVQTILVIDNTAPVVITVIGSLDANLQCSDFAGIAKALTLVPSATDNCTNIPVLQLISDKTTLDATCANAYKRVRTWNFTDGCGNVSADFVQTITVIDNTAPVVSTVKGSLDANLQCSDFAGIAKALTLAPSGMDNCTDLPVLHLISDKTTPDATCANAYLRVRIWNFTDGCGNVSENFVQTITVYDNTAPVVTTSKGSLDANLLCSNVTGIAAALARIPVTTDNCTVDPTIHLISDVTSIDATCANAYIRVRTWNFTDGCGNTSTDFIQTITVFDNTAPVVTTLKGSLDANLQCSNSVGIAAALALLPVATDNCTAVPTIHLVSDVTTPDALCANAYKRTRTWNFTDGCGNTSANFVQTITVIDNTAPVITGSISVTTVEGCSAFNATPPVKTVAELIALGLNITDGCTPATAMTVSSTDISSGVNPVVVTRTYIVTDGCGNMATHVYQTINVKLSLTAVATPKVVTCTGDRNGSVNLAVSDGTTPFKYSWTGSGGFTSISKDLVGLSGGVYNVTVTDALGCSVTTTATVNESSVKLALSLTGTNASKSGAMDGTIDATIIGGTAPFKFSWIGPDSFVSTTEDLTGLRFGTYTLSVGDNYGCSVSGSFAVLDPPTANDDAVTTNEDVPVTFNITTNDTDADGIIVPNTIDLDPSTPGQQTSFTIPKQGTFTVNSSGEVTFVPVPLYNGTTTPIFYTVKDNSGLISNFGKITIVVNAVNYPPVVADVPKSGPEDTDIRFTLFDFTSKFTDVDGDAMTKIKVVSLPKNGILKLNGVPVSVNDEISIANIPKLTFTPTTNWNGFTTFDWNGFDGTVYAVVAAHVNIIITSVNDGPVAVDDHFETKVNVKLFGNVLPNDYDIDNNIITVEINPLKSTTNGTLVLSSNGDFTYQPNKDFVGNDSFTYRICDNGNPSLCSTAVVTIVVARDESCAVIVPNVFTPNGDGINDYFKVTCLYNYDNPEMQIFNRNGNLIFKKDHYGNLDYWGSEDQALWNGRSQNNLDFFGSDLPVGTYYYIFNVGNGKVLTGFIFLAK